MRLLILNHRTIYDGYGGVEYYLHDLACLGARTLGFSNMEVLAPFVEQKPESPQYPIHWVARRSGLLSGKLRFSPSYLKQVISRAQSFHPTLILAGHVSLAPIAMAASSFTQIPYGVMGYGIDVWGNFWPQDRWALKRADLIVSISRWTRDKLVKQGFEASKIHVIHPTLSDFGANISIKERTPGPLRMLCVGRLDSSEKYKGQDHILQAMLKIRNHSPSTKVELSIVGSGDDLPRIRRMAENLGLAKQVHFHSPVSSRCELATHYSNADLFVMPSRYGFWDGKWHGEGFGIVYTDAAQFGLPTLAYDCGGVKDIVSSGMNGILVPPNNIQKLSEAIVDFDVDRDALAVMGENARMACQQFSALNIQNQFVAMFDKLVPPEVPIHAHGWRSTSGISNLVQEND